MEDEIDSNIDALHGAASRLNKLVRRSSDVGSHALCSVLILINQGRAMGQEVDVQNKHIDRIAGKVCSHHVP